MELLTEKNISPFAIPGIIESYEHFIAKLRLKTPVLVPDDKFREMWVIFEKVCSVYGKDPVSIYLKNKRRYRPAVEIRQISMVLFRKELNYPQSVCALFFYLEHAAVIHSIKTINNLRETDREFRRMTDIFFKKYE